MFSIVHVSDPHFGREADLEKVAGVAALVPDLEPNLVVLSGDVTQRARHGEFQAARVWLRELERTAPSYVIPGNHDVQWWRRPLIGWKPQAKYAKFARYFGPVVAPTQRFGEAVVASALTSHGLAWRSLTSKARDLTVMGHVTRAEIDRVAGIFRQSEPHLGRVLVMHHNVLRGEASHRMGLTRWQKVHRWLMDSGAELVLCGHDHLEKADVMGGVVISCAGSLSARQFEGRTASFQRIVLEENSIQVEPYRWDADLKRFRRSDVFAFARKGARRDAREPAGAV